MDPISIYFFALASIIGMDNTSIVAQKTNITINPIEKTLEVHLEDLFSIIMTTDDSLTVAHELQQIVEFHTNAGKKTAENLIIEDIVLSKNDQQLNATLKGRYTDPKVLADAGISFEASATGEFSMINIPDWNIRSSDAVLKGNYWIWTADKPVTIVMESFENMPDEYRKHRRSILPYWEQSQVRQPKK